MFELNIKIGGGEKMIGAEVLEQRDETTRYDLLSMVMTLQKIQSDLILELGEEMGLSQGERIDLGDTERSVQ